MHGLSLIRVGFRFKLVPFLAPRSPGTGSAWPGGDDFLVEVGFKGKFGLKIVVLVSEGFRRLGGSELYALHRAFILG